MFSISECSDECVGYELHVHSTVMAQVLDGHPGDALAHCLQYVKR